MRKAMIILFLLLPLITKEGGVKSTEDPFDEYLYKGLKEFKNILGYAESNHNPKAVGRNYYKGTYQIGIEAAKDVNVPYDSLLIPRCNDTAVVRYMRKNWSYLGSCIYFDKKGNKRFTKNYQPFVGSIINGIKITKAGLLAAAHLKGHLSVKVYLDTNGQTNPTDPNGKSVEDYIRMMQNVNLIKY